MQEAGCRMQRHMAMRLVYVSEAGKHKHGIHNYNIAIRNSTFPLSPLLVVPLPHNVILKYFDLPVTD